MNQLQNQRKKSGRDGRKPTRQDAADVQRLELQKLRLERDYELARIAIHRSQGTTAMSMGSVLIMFVLAYVASMVGAVALLNGAQLVMCVGIATTGLVAYAAMIFGRAARIKARLTATEKELELALGDDVRANSTI